MTYVKNKDFLTGELKNGAFSINTGEKPKGKKRGN